MLTHPTLDQLHALGLHGMAKAFTDIEAGGEAASLGHAEWLALLLEREASLRRDIAKSQMMIALHGVTRFLTAVGSFSKTSFPLGLAPVKHQLGGPGSPGTLRFFMPR